MRKHLFKVFATFIAVAVWTSVGFLNMGSQAATILTEDFEAGGKPAYAAGNVTLGTGSWYLDDALTGNTTSDPKTGAYSARVRNIGKVRMNFNVSSAAVVSIQHAVFGSDGSSTWELWSSTNNGSSWTKVGATITSSLTTLSTVGFRVNVATPIRFEIRKIAGGTNRINFDNISVSDFITSTPTPTPTATPTPIVTPTPTPTPAPTSSVHLTMGNPSNAIMDVNQPSNYLLDKPQYVMSYNRDNGRPNWVSWHLDLSWLGSTPRQDSFRPDTSLPAGWYQVQATDFSGSGYDRGHMCPSGDRTKSVADNDATFFMTNMLAQAPVNNQQSWASLESYCRTLANSGNELYIISGGEGTSGFIAGGRVAVPTNTWKVIMVLPSGSKDVLRVSIDTRLIAVVIPNNNNVVNDWRQYRVSTDYVESITGFDFFSNVDNAVEARIESIIDTQSIAEWEMIPDEAAVLENFSEAEKPSAPMNK